MIVPAIGSAGLPEVSVNVESVSVAGSISSLNVALTCSLIATSLPPLSGEMLVIVGVVPVVPPLSPQAADTASSTNAAQMAGLGLVRNEATGFSVIVEHIMIDSLASIMPS